MKTYITETISKPVKVTIRERRLNAKFYIHGGSFEEVLSAIHDRFGGQEKKETEVRVKRKYTRRIQPQAVAA